MTVARVALGDVAEFVRGVTFKPADVVPEGVPVMTTKAVQKTLVQAGASRIPAGLVRRSEQFLRGGDTLVSTANSWNLVGKCCWVPQLHEPSAIGGFVAVLRPKSGVEPRYLYHWFSSPTIQAAVRSLGNQTTNIANLNLTRCLQIPIPLPPMEDQLRIADILDQADRLCNKRREVLRHLDDLAQSIFLEMFGCGEEISPELPTLRVDQTGRVQLGRQRAPKYQLGLAPRPYVRVANVHLNRLALGDVLTMDFDESDFVSYKLHHGDILLNEGQSTELVGRPAMWRDEIDDCCFQNTLVRYQADRSLVEPAYALAVFLHFFRRGRFAAISSKTSSVAHLGAGRFAAMSFPLASLTMQREFVRRLAIVSSLSEFARQQIETSDELFASLQDRAFAGSL